MKTIVLMFLFMLCGFVVYSQEEATHSPVHIGLKGGAILHSLLPREVKLSYQVGTTCRLQLKNGRSVQTEFLLTNLRTKLYRNYYLLMPLLYKFEVNLGFSLEFGAQMNLNIYNDFGVEFFKTPDLGLCAGFSSELGDMSYINIRYSRGLTRVFDNENIKASIFALTLVQEF